MEELLKNRWSVHGVITTELPVPDVCTIREAVMISQSQFAKLINYPGFNPVEFDGIRIQSTQSNCSRGQPHLGGDDVPGHRYKLVTAALDQAELDQARHVGMDVLVVTLQAARQFID